MYNIQKLNKNINETLLNKLQKSVVNVY